MRERGQHLSFVRFVASWVVCALAEWRTVLSPKWHGWLHLLLLLADGSCAWQRGT